LIDGFPLTFLKLLKDKLCEIDTFSKLKIVKSNEFNDTQTQKEEEIITWVTLIIEIEQNLWSLPHSNYNFVAWAVCI